MRNNSLGEIIRSLRKQANLSQEELAEGICSTVSISRIENGMQMPSSTVLEAILSKLGAGTYQICDIYYKSERQLAFEENAEHVMKLISSGHIEEAKNQLALLSNISEDDLNTQYTLLIDASIKLYEQDDLQTIMHILKQALALTKPSFDFSNFRNLLLTPREANILNVLVAVLYRNGDTFEAIRMGEELLTALKKHKSGLKEYLVIKINLAINLSQCMEKEHRYKEALMYIELAEDCSINSSEQVLLPEIEFIKAKEYHLLGDDENCIKIIRAVVPYMELVKKVDFAKLVKKYAYNELHIEL